MNIKTFIALAVIALTAACTAEPVPTTEPSEAATEVAPVAGGSVREQGGNQQAK